MVWFVIFLALLIPLIAVVLDSQLGRAIAGRLEQNKAITGDEGVSRRVTQLESELERLNSEVLRLDDETAFLHKLLENKPPQQGELPPGERPD